MIGNSKLTRTKSKQSPVILRLLCPTFTVYLYSPSDASLVDRLCNSTAFPVPAVLIRDLCPPPWIPVVRRNFSFFILSPSQDKMPLDILTGKLKGLIWHRVRCWCHRLGSTSWKQNRVSIRSRQSFIRIGRIERAARTSADYTLSSFIHTDRRCVATNRIFNQLLCATIGKKGTNKCYCLRFEVKLMVRENTIYLIFSSLGPVIWTNRSFAPGLTVFFVELYIEIVSL